MIVDGKYVYREDLPFWANYTIANIDGLELDPVYCAVRASIPEIGIGSTHRFLMAMSLFYNMATACHITDNTTEETFWGYCISNYKTLKRGTERRYFHGEQGMKCLDYLKDNFKGPTDFIEKNHSPTYKGVLANFAKVPAYGNYHTWKFWDFYDRILGMRVEADESCWKAMPAEPLGGMEKVAMEMGMSTDNLIDVGKYCVNFLQEMKVMAPPDNDRLVHIAEIETGMCGLSHHLKGTDWVGIDLVGYHNNMATIEGSTADVMTKNLPPLLPRDFFLPPPDVVAKISKMFPKYKPYKPMQENTTRNLLDFA